MSNIKEIEVNIKGKEWEEAIDKAYNKASKKVKIDGFRQGKAPKDLFLKKYGKERLHMDAADTVIEKAYTKMIDQHKEEIKDLVARPDIEVKKIDDKGVEFKFILTLKPEVKLGKYKNLDVKKEKAKATKEEIDHAIYHIKEKYAENVLKEDKIVDGDIAIIDFEGFVDDKPFDGGKGENYSLTIGSHTFIPGFEEALIGLKAGDKKDIKVTFPKDYQADNLKGKDAVFKVKINEVKEIKVPELDKEFFEDLAMEGVDSKESLEKHVKENIIKQKEHEIENKYMDDLLEAAAKEVKVEIPDVMIEEELDRMVKQYSDHLQMQGMDIEQFLKFTNSDMQALRDQMKDEAIKRITYRLMLEEIINKEKIEITDKQAEKEAEKMAESYQATKEELINLIGGLEMIKYDLSMRKAMDVIKGEEK